MKLVSLLVALAFVVGVHASVERIDLDLAADAEWLSKYWDEYLSVRETWLPPVSIEPINLGCMVDAEYISKIWDEEFASRTCTFEVDKEWCVHSIKPIW